MLDQRLEKQRGFKAGEFSSGHFQGSCTSKLVFVPFFMLGKLKIIVFLLPILVSPHSLNPSWLPRTEHKLVLSPGDITSLKQPKFPLFLTFLGCVYLVCPLTIPESAQLLCRPPRASDLLISVVTGETRVK